MTEFLLIRHGETEWSRTGRHTGRTDVPLTGDGEAKARALAPRLAGREFALQLCSPLARARHTAALAGLHPEIDDDLLEWDYGAWEGRTTADIRTELQEPSWVVWDADIPAGATPGERPYDVAVRAQRVIDRCLPVLEAGNDAVLIAHGHLLRILAATWLGLPADAGRLLALDAGALSALGFERRQRVIAAWNT